MKNKIVSLFLLFSILLSFFSISLFAEEREKLEDSLINDPGEKMEFNAASNGELYNTEFSRFIDVEKYVSNVGTKGYDKLAFVGVEEYYRERDPLLVFYVFNPENIQFYVNQEIEDLSYACCYIDMFDTNGALFTALGALEQPSDGDMSPMFFRLFVPTLGGDYGLPSSIGNAQERVYTVSNIRFTDGVGLAFYNVVLMQTMSFTGFDADKKCSFSNASSDVFRSTSPMTDLLFLFSDEYSSVDDLKEKFPLDNQGNMDSVFLYESDFGSSKYSLYFYLYNPRGYKIKGNVSVVMYNPSRSAYETFDFKFVNSEGSIYKFVCSSGLSCFEGMDYRQYIISEINISYLPSGSSGTSNFKLKLTDTLCFDYSDFPSYQYVKPTYKYELSLPLVSYPGDEILLYSDDQNVSVINFKKYHQDVFVPVVEEDTYIEVNLYSQVEYGKCTLKFSVNTELPLYQDNIVITYGTKDDLQTYVLKPQKTDNIYSPGVLSATFTRDVQRKALYLTAERNGIIEIEASPTYYRLNSSSAGDHYYQTLSSIYFDLPLELLQADLINGFFGGGFVSAIELYYESVMCQPGLVVKSGSKVEEIANRINSGDFDKNGTAIYSVLDIEYGLYDVDEYYAYDFAFGINCKDVYDGDVIFYGEIPYLFVSDGWKDFDEVISSKELTEKINSEQKFISDEFNVFQNVFSFDQEMYLSSFKDLSIKEQSAVLGWIKTLLFKVGWLDEDVQESMSFRAIDTLYGTDLQNAYNMTDVDLFCDTYAVAASDYDAVKKKMLECINNNRAFVLLRFDVFDYYCSQAGFYTDDGIFDTYMDATADAFVFQTKYYKDVDVLSLEVSDFIGTKKLYDVVMDPINFAPGLTYQPSVDDLIQDPGEAIKDSYGALFTGEGDKTLAILTSLIILLVVLIVLTICFPGVMLPIINGAVNLLGSGISFCITLVGNGFKTLTGFFRRK